MADDDAWRDSKLGRKGHDGGLRDNAVGREKARDVTFRHEELSSGLVCFMLAYIFGSLGIGSIIGIIGIGTTFLVDKNLATPVLQNMSCLMKEREPEMVVRFVAQAELNHGAIGNPTRNTTHASLGQLWNEENHDARLCATAAHLRLKNLWRLSR